MEKDVRDLLEEAIRGDLTKLTTMSPTDEGYKAAVDAIEKLYKLKVDEEISEMDYRLKVDQMEYENRLNEKKIAQDKIFRIIGHAVEGAGVVLSFVQLGRWMDRGFRFEETGTYTSQTFRTLFSKFIPKLK